MPDRPDSAMVSVHLVDRAELFAAPPLDPFRGVVETRSGIDRIRDQLPSGWAPVTIAINLDNAPDGDTQDAVDAVRTALVSYCDAQIDLLYLARDRVRRLGLKELGFGLAFLALCLLGGSAISAAGVGPGWIQTFVVEGLVIVGWIALWHPVDMLFFDRLPLVRDQRVFRRIRDAQVTVVVKKGEHHAG